MYKIFLRENILLSTILIFLFIFIIIQILKPKFLYNDDGSLREFGVGYRNKTIFPLWLLSIILGILSYISVLYVIKYN